MKWAMSIIISAMPGIMKKINFIDAGIACRLYLLYGKKLITRKSVE